MSMGMTTPEDDDEVAIDLLSDEIEAPQIGDPEPEILMTSDEAEAYLDTRYAKWRKLPPPPGALVFGATSFSQSELDKWLERWTRTSYLGDDDSFFP